MPDSSSPTAPSGAPSLQSPSSPDPEALLQEYGLEDHRVLRRVLKDLGEELFPDEETLRTYLSEKSGRERPGPVLWEIQSEEAAEVSADLVRREIQETDARLQLQEAQDRLERARREKEAASRHLLGMIERSADLPADTNWGVDATRGTVHELPVDVRGPLFELSVRLFQLGETELSLIEENGGELFPDPIEEALGQIEEEAPKIEARAFLTDLAALLRQFGEPGRKLVLTLLDQPEGARAIAGTGDLPDPLRFLAQLRLT